VNEWIHLSNELVRHAYTAYYMYAFAVAYRCFVITIKDIQENQYIDATLTTKVPAAMLQVYYVEALKTCLYCCV